MANAVKKISLAERPRRHRVDARRRFGGAGGFYACGGRRPRDAPGALIPPMAGVLSALRDRARRSALAVREQAVPRVLDAGLMPRLLEIASAQVPRHGARCRVPSPRSTRMCVTAISTPWRAPCCATRGAIDIPLSVAMSTPEQMPDDFDAVYRRTYSFLMDRPLVVEAVSVEAVAWRPARPGSARDDRRRGGRGHVLRRAVARTCRCTLEPSLAARETVAGPTIMGEADATAMVEPGWAADRP